MKFSTFVCVFLFGLNSFAQQEKAPVQQPKPTFSEKELRPRDHNISVQYSVINADLEASNGNETESKRGELSVNYSRNFGHYAFGLGVSSNVTDTGTTDVTNATFEVLARWNFIENKPGHDWIPFATVNLANYSEEYEAGAGDIDTDGNLFGLSVGVTWYPFSELFAFELAYGRFSGELDYESPLGNGDIDAVYSGLTLASILSF